MVSGPRRDGRRGAADARRGAADGQRGAADGAPVLLHGALSGFRLGVVAVPDGGRALCAAPLAAARAPGSAATGRPLDASPLGLAAVELAGVPVDDGDCVSVGLGVDPVPDVESLPASKQNRKHYSARFWKKIKFELRTTD